MNDSFKIKYEIDDGYVGPSAPQTIEITTDDLDVPPNDYELETFYIEIIQDDFSNKIYPYGINLEEFREWAREQLKNEETE